MPKEYSRSERVADFIKREVALLLQRELRDPRVSNANVNAVVVSRDMSTAKIYLDYSSAWPYLDECSWDLLSWY